MALRIATWNVNSLRVRLDQVLAWLDAQRPDVLALQEIKLSDEQFPVAEIEEHGYHSVYAGQKTYNGVALLARRRPEAVRREVPGLDDPQKRFIAATIEGVRIVNLYVVNGQAVGSEKYAYKLRWLDAVHAYLVKEVEAGRPLVVLGDFNIAPEDRDVYDPQAWRERILCSTPEREALARLLATGLEDTYRRLDTESGGYTWWDYRAAGFRRDHGMRIDLILASRALADRCTRCTVDREPRRAERPSDHAPLIAEFSTAD